MPINYELIRKHALIIQKLHERRQVLLLRSVAFNEIEDDCLQKSLDSDFTVTFYKFQESHLILRPTFYNVPLVLE